MGAGCHLIRMLRGALPLGFPFLRVGLAVLALMIAGSGCKPTDLQSARIAADDTTSFYRWKRDVGSQLSAEAQKQLETAVEEIRLDAMLRKQASGHDALEAAVCQRLNHLSVKAALLLGAQIKWQRLAAERDDLQRVANANAHLITKPGDQAAATDLEQYRAKFQQRITALTRDLQAIEQEIQALGGMVPVLSLSAPATAPVAVSRAEALQQIAGMLQGRRGAATIHYGAWPVKIDWEGRQLEGDKRTEFLAKKIVNGRGEKVIIPVRIKGRWLLFEAPDQAPALPDDVRAQFTAAELVTFKRDWIELEAELWARQLTQELPDPPSATEDEPAAQPVRLHK
jgi:hypothetical protein